MAASLSSSMDSLRAAELRCCSCQVLMEVKKERINRLLNSGRRRENRIGAGSGSRKKEKSTSFVCCTCCHGSQPAAARIKKQI